MDTTINLFHKLPETVKKEKLDTIVVSKVLPADISGTSNVEQKYFVVINKDTSRFSCILSQNKLNGNISIYCSYMYGKPTNTFSLEDTAATVHVNSEKNNQYYFPKYKEQINELKIILENISKKVDLSKLASFRFSMITFKSFSQSITDQYIKLYGKNFASNSNSKVVNLIKKSNLIVDLNKILKSHSVIINKVFLDGLAFYQPENFDSDENLKSSIIASKKIIDGLIIFNVAKIPIEAQ